MRKEVCSVVVLYHPDNEVFKNLRKLSEQSDHVIAINNGFIDPDKFYGKFTESGDNIQLVNLGRNEGIAYALNVGVGIARRLGYRWLATFDQDSTISEDYFKNMFSDYDRCKVKDIAVIAPLYYSTSTHLTTTYTSERYLLYRNTGCKFVDTTVTSGNILDLYLIMDREPFESGLFIDQVDNDFNLDIIDRGLLILETNAILLHNLGSQKSYKFFNKNPITNNHSAFRRYFMARNRIYVYKKHFSKHKTWVIYDFKHSILDIIKTILFEDNKLDKLKNTFLGTLHGLTFDLSKFRDLNYVYTHQSIEDIADKE